MHGIFDGESEKERHSKINTVDFYKKITKANTYTSSTTFIEQAHCSSKGELLTMKYLQLNDWSLSLCSRLVGYSVERCILNSGEFAQKQTENEDELIEECQSVIIDVQ